MRKFAIAGVAALAIAGSTAVYAQYQHRQWFHHHERMSPEDKAAFADARIAAVHAGLKLNPDQEKLWPPVETAVRDFAKLRIDRANARMNAQRDDSKDAQKQDSQKQDSQMPDDPVARLRNRADTMATTAAAMKKIADAADPLYKTLDDGQKRRLAILTHIEHRFGEGGQRRGFERGMDGDRGRGDDRDRGNDRDRGYDRDGGPGRDHRGGAGPERL
jgi:LTXXQ motif family protein